MIVLPSHFRFTAYNATGQTISQNNIKVYVRRAKLGSDGVPAYESSWATLTINSGGTLANATYANGADQDNTTNKYQASECVFEVVAPASSAGDVLLYLDLSYDNGTNWNDNGLGIPVAALNFTTSGTKRIAFLL